jgi:hypothetical protein
MLEYLLKKKPWWAKPGQETGKVDSVDKEMLRR